MPQFAAFLSQWILAVVIGPTGQPQEVTAQALIVCTTRPLEQGGGTVKVCMPVCMAGDPLCDDLGIPPRHLATPTPTPAPAPAKKGGGV